MRRLLLFSLVAVVIFALSLGAAVLIGRQHPDSKLLESLHLTDCAPPCWIGIIPGQTTLKEAKARIATAFPPADGYLATFGWLSGSTVEGLSLGKNDDPFGLILITLDGQSDDVIDTITFNFNSVYVRNRATLAEIHHQFGAPPRVLLPNATLYRPNDLAFAYGDDQSGIVAFTPPGTYVQLEQEIYLLVFYARNQIPLPRSAELHHWHGFRVLRGYYRLN